MEPDPMEEDLPQKKEGKALKQEELEREELVIILRHYDLAKIWDQNGMLIKQKYILKKERWQ